MDGATGGGDSPPPMVDKSLIAPGLGGGLAASVPPWDTEGTGSITASGPVVGDDLPTME